MTKELYKKKWRCNKRPYATKKVAKETLKRIKKQKGREEVRVYFCDICDAFHLTKLKRRFPIDSR